MIKEKKIWILLFLLFFGALCFGGGVLYGQFMLTEKGFVYEENAAAETGAEQQVADGDKININRASAKELQRVPGIGALTAEKIVSSREEEGDFDDLHHLVDRGILGESKLEQIAPYLKAE